MILRNKNTILRLGILFILILLNKQSTFSIEYFVGYIGLMNSGVFHYGYPVYKIINNKIYSTDTIQQMSNISNKYLNFRIIENRIYSIGYGFTNMDYPSSTSFSLIKYKISDLGKASIIHKEPFANVSNGMILYNNSTVEFIQGDSIYQINLATMERYSFNLKSNNDNKYSNLFTICNLYTSKASVMTNKYIVLAYQNGYFKSIDTIIDNKKLFSSFAILDDTIYCLGSKNVSNQSNYYYEYIQKYSIENDKVYLNKECVLSDTIDKSYRISISNKKAYLKTDKKLYIVNLETMKEEILDIKE